MANETIYVRSGRKDNKVALWERNTDHPNEEGEVYVAADYQEFAPGMYGDIDRAMPVEVTLTPAVGAALANGQLVRVRDDRSSEAARRAEAIEENTGRTPQDPDEVRAALQAGAEQRAQAASAAAVQADRAAELARKEADLARREAELNAREANLGAEKERGPAEQRQAERAEEERRLRDEQRAPMVGDPEEHERAAQASREESEARDRGQDPPSGTTRRSGNR